MNKQNKGFPKFCPSCDRRLKVTRLRCDDCETEVSGSYHLPLLAALSGEDQDFVLQFVRASGSLKQIAKERGVSYPTVRNRLNEIIETLNNQNNDDEPSEHDE